MRAKGEGGAEDEMVREHHQLSGYEFEPTPGENERQGGLMCCSPWGRRVRHNLASESESHSVVSDTLQPHGLYRPRNSPGQIPGVGSLSLLQGIFPTQGSNPGLPHCRWVLYQLSHKGTPSILEWVAYPFSRGSSQPRNQTRVSCIAGRFFTN